MHGSDATTAGVRILCRFRPLSEREAAEPGDKSYKLYVDERNVRIESTGQLPQTYSFDINYTSDSSQVFVLLTYFVTKN